MEPHESEQRALHFISSKGFPTALGVRNKVTAFHLTALLYRNKVTNSQLFCFRFPIGTTPPVDRWKFTSWPTPLLLPQQGIWDTSLNPVSSEWSSTIRLWGCQYFSLGLLPNLGFSLLLPSKVSPSQSEIYISLKRPLDVLSCSNKLLKFPWHHSLLRWKRLNWKYCECSREVCYSSGSHSTAHAPWAELILSRPLSPLPSTELKTEGGVYLANMCRTNNGYQWDKLIIGSTVRIKFLRSVSEKCWVDHLDVRRAKIALRWRYESCSTTDQSKRTQFVKGELSSIGVSLHFKNVLQYNIKHWQLSTSHKER